MNIFIIQICELLNSPELNQPVVINDLINMVFWDFLQRENIVYVPERSIMYVTVSACFLIRFAFRGF